MKELAIRPTAESMVSAYEGAIRHLEQTFAHIEEAKKLLAQGFVSENIYSSDFLPYKLTCHSFEGVKKEVKRNVWQRIISLLELPTFMPPKKLHKLQDQIEKDEAPEITVQNILQFSSDIYNSLPGMVTELTKETFEWLRPAKWHENYKTNKKYRVGKKVIKNWCIEVWGHSYVRLRATGEDNLHIMDNVFHLLDGKGASKYPGDAITRIRQAIESKKWSCETEYFQFKWYKKGSLHIQFKRADLLKKLNKIGSDDTLPEREAEHDN